MLVRICNDTLELTNLAFKGNWCKIHQFIYKYYFHIVIDFVSVCLSVYHSSLNMSRVDNRHVSSRPRPFYLKSNYWTTEQ